MIILVQTRSNNYHLVDYTAYNGNKYTVCGLVYHTNNIVNTLALDAAFPGVCQSCYDHFDNLQKRGLNAFIRDFKGKSLRRAESMYHWIQDRDYSIEIKYFHPIKRNSLKINRYQKKVKR